jgi:hypothetical protein
VGILFKELGNAFVAFVGDVEILSGLASGGHLDVLRACLEVSGKAPFFSTIRAGLESHCVFIVGIERGSHPHLFLHLPAT